VGIHSKMAIPLTIFATAVLFGGCFAAEPVAEVGEAGAELPVSTGSPAAGHSARSSSERPHLVELATVTPSSTLAGTRGPVAASGPHVATAAVDDGAPQEIDVPRLRRHVESIAKLIGHPARALAAKLGAAATIGDGTIEWNLDSVGVEAASAYGYANVADGIVTGFVIRGRASLDTLLRLHLHRPVQLTRAGGERPAYSITAGE
jgi:hypothetical protein